MAINIQSLFSDIIETPAQRQERMLTEGILKGRELTGGLTGLARTQAPLVSALSMQMPQRQEALRRNVGGMLGLDVRTESEKVQEALQGVDPNDPQSLIQAAQAVGNLGLGAQSAQMRAMAADVTRQKQADLMAQQDFAMRQAQAADSIFDSQFRRDLAERAEEREIGAEARTQAEFLIREQANVLQINQLAEQISTTRNLKANLGSLATSIEEIAPGYETIAELVRSEAMAPAAAISQIYANEAKRFTLSEFKQLPKNRAEEIYALAKESDVLKDALDRGFFSGEAEISEARFNNLASRIASAYPSMDNEGIVKAIEAQQTIGLMESLAQTNTESIAEQIAGSESEGGVDLEAMAGAAAALAGSDETVSAELAMPSPEDYLSDQPQRTGLKASQQTAEVLSGLMQPSDIVTQRRQEQGEAEQARRDAVEAGLRGPALRRYLDDFRAYQESKRQ
jgi:hypothetical protein